MVTGGARWEWRGEEVSLYADASAMDTIYGKYIFLRSRYAVVGQAGLRWQL
jgi:hypothetical protein